MVPIFIDDIEIRNFMNVFDAVNRYPIEKKIN